ncbi:hemophore-related protein [Mycolicibacterium sediminis]|uniref:Haemophore haem-binding domain-containing protein n=1 Tax=Mycolicibacterium sediminis TaxID=1286180 RepID=A0A7I7QIE2_9MYCO|nr:hemophore-related protein [Mycolicibacterium sediminis]BBY26099.1 hypothetical protein MSEDJ_01950 [Mycolicibacterium sediminis]
MSNVRRSLIVALATVGAGAVAALPVAAAEPTPTPSPAPATSAPAEPVVADDCNAATLASTISTVTAELSTYFAAHPDVNQALIDATRQPAFIAVGQFDGYFADHPDEANDLRAIQAPLNEYKDRCGLQVAPTDALAVLAEV